MQSSRELFAHQIKIETSEIESNPEEEMEELALIYEARGLKQEQAKVLASQIMVNKEYAVQTLARKNWAALPGKLPLPAFSFSLWAQLSRFHLLSSILAPTQFLSV